VKNTNMLERLNAEIKRRTRVVRIFPHTETGRLTRLCAAGRTMKKAEPF
jgi:transposase-like protein